MLGLRGGGALMVRTHWLHVRCVLSLCPPRREREGEARG